MSSSTGIHSLVKEISYKPWVVKLTSLDRKVWVVPLVLLLVLLVTVLVLVLTTSQGCGEVRVVNETQLPCLFPFSYKGVEYSECTTVDNHGILWCSTNTDHLGTHIKGEWGDCPQEPCSGGCKTISGPDTGSFCHFPFIWRNKVYRQCTTSHNKGVMWCATSTGELGEYVKDMWGNCGDRCSGCKTQEGVPCMFPFEYNGINHSECTTEGRQELWCHTGGPDWGLCDEGCSAGCHTHSGLPCLFPFIYNGTKYSECTDVDNGGRDWCPTQLAPGGQYIEGEWADCGPGC